MREFHYHIAWRSRSVQPGSHRSTQRGGGTEFSRHASLLDAPDPRRYDLRASLRDPMQRALIKIYNQPGAVPVVCLADLSASMACGTAGADTRKLDLLADFVAGLGYSAYRSGDWLSFIGADRHLRDEFYLGPSRRKQAGLELAAQLRAFTPNGDGGDGLLAAAGRLGRRRSLVFLASDFYLPLALLEKILASLEHHQVVPLALWDDDENKVLSLPRLGLARLRDSETGRERTLFLRPGLNARLRERYQRRRSALQKLFARRGQIPLCLQGSFDPDAVTRYFYQ